MSIERTIGPTFLGILTLILITLRLSDVIDWSWWYVLMPLWGAWAIVGLILIGIVIVLTIKWLFDKIK
jgi:hypothetical protein